MAIFISLLGFMSHCQESTPHFDNTHQTMKSTPSRTVYHVKMVSKDSGRVKFQVEAPLLEEYGFSDTVYYWLPKGIKGAFYNTGKNPVYVLADTAKIIESTKQYWLKGHVVVVSDKKDTLRSASLYWDGLNKRIYSKDTTHIKQASGTRITAVRGFEASEDFKTILMMDNNGDMPIKD